MGARESSAGDEFHLLWAARRATELLDRSATLDRLFVEKLADEDDPDGDDRLLTADVVEYHGGDTMFTADRVDIVQLKYSTRAPGRSWTVARLAEGAPQKGTTTRRNVSLIRRLSDAAAYSVERLGQRVATEKLRVRLVSNQPAGEALVQAVDAAVAAGGATMATVLRRLGAEDADRIRRLYQASGQQSKAFVVFLRCLDLSGCGEAPRATLRGQLCRDLSPFAPANPMRSARALVDLVHFESLPEGEGSLGIDLERVLAALGASSLDVLFPAPPKFDPVDRPIDTGDVRRVADAVIGAPARKVVVHGDAGVGKTTTSLLMHRHLPPGSVLVPYDCFGGGDYLDTGAQRHTVRRVLRQLVNELAVRCGTPFLVVDEMDLPDLERHFVAVLGDAAAMVRSRGGLLVLLIDAADNAAFAALRDGDSAIPRLWDTDVPEGARIVMSARTHRRYLLSEPDSVENVLLTGFDSDASAEHLRQAYPEASDHATAAFHGRTQGNPRVQWYALDAGGPLGDVVERSKRTPADLFEQIYKAALGEAKDSDHALGHAAALLALVRPGGVRVLAAAEGLTESAAEAFCRGLVPGVRIESEGDDIAVAFRDEDFERYLVGRVGEDRIRDAHDRYATWCLTTEQSDPYAARAIADHLAAAGRDDELVAFVLADGAPDVIEDDVARFEVRQRRARLALRAAASDEDGARVVLLLAEMARERGGFASVVRQAPGLAVRYADPGAVGRLFLREDRDRQWLGPAHFHAAAVMSADPLSEAVARRHLHAGRAWVDEWVRKGEPQHWRIETQDIVRELVATCRLDGTEDAARQGGRWTSRRLRLDLAYGTARAAALSLDDAFDGWTQRLGPVLRAAALAGAWAAGTTLDADVLVDAAEALRAANRNGRRRDTWSGQWAVDFADALAHVNGAPDLVASIVDAFGLSAGVYYDQYARRGPSGIRQASLCAAVAGRDLTVLDLMPPSLHRMAALRGTGTKGSWPEIVTEDAEKRKAEENERKAIDDWHTRVEPLLPVSRARARALVGTLGAESVQEILDKALSVWNRRDGAYHRRYDGRWEDWLRMAVDTAGYAQAGLDSVLWLDDSVRAGTSAEPDAAWLSMAEQASRFDTLATAALHWIDAAVTWQRDHDAPVADRRDLLLRAAQAALPLDEARGRDLYLEALEAASELDDQGGILLRSHARLVESADFAPEVARSLALRLPESVDLLAPKVSDRRSLPYDATVCATLSLSLERGLEAWARWADADATSLHSPLPEAADIAARGGIEPEEEIALLRAADALTVVGATAALNRLPPGDRRRRLFARVTDAVLRDASPAARIRMARSLAEWSTAYDLRDSRERLVRIAEFGETLATDTADSPAARQSRLPHVPDRDAAADVERAVAAAVSDAQSGAFGALGERWQTATRSTERITTGEFVSRVADAVRPSDRVRFLESLVSGTASEHLSRHSAEATVDAVRAQIVSWRGSRDVRRAEAGLGVRLLMEHLPGLVGYWGEPRRAMDETLAMVPESDHAGTVRAALPLHLPDLSVHDLYSVFEVLAERLPTDARGRVLAESLARRERSTRSTVSAPDHDESVEPASEAALARFLWSLLGNRDRRVRWRALHAVYGMMVDLPETRAVQVMEHLLNGLSEPGDERLRQDGRLFLWHSARVSLLQLALRLAYGAPAVVAPFGSRLAGTALDRDRPHIVARELARRATLRLVEGGHYNLSGEDLDRLRAANQPRACQLDKKDSTAWGPYHREWHRDDEDPFGFDTLDTVPYWYGSLNERLNVEPGTVLERAKVWVIERWGFRRAMWWDEVHETYDRGERRVYKGSIPPVEDFRPYAEFHAMMYVAGELIDEGAEVLQAQYSDGREDPWADWLGRYMPFRDEVWAAELLSETPLLPELWGRLSSLDDWIVAPEPEAYDAALGLPDEWDGRTLPDWLCVRSFVNTHASDRSGDLTISSALVSPGTAEALSRALLDVDSSNWALPDLDPTGYEYPEMHEIQSGPYELTGWMSWSSPERESLDEHDPLRRGASVSFGSPGARMAAALGLTGGPDRWLDDQGRLAFTFERWSDAPPDPDRWSSPYTLGYRMQASVPSLLSALRVLGRDLLIEVRHQRNESYERRRHDDDPERPFDLGRSRLYHLRGDGRLTRCEPEAGAWARDRPRTQR